MRIGLVSWWFNRGQATVSRYLRSIFDDLGHQTFVLARPTADDFPSPRFVATSDVWSQKEVTPASQFDMPSEEYLAWASANAVDVVFFDQNYQFDAIAQLRSTGVRTVGRFVWEQFREGDVAGALRAFDCIYSLTRCEQDRYRAMGLDSPRVPWGCHPELLTVETRNEPDTIRFFYPGGYFTERKPTNQVLQAFRALDHPAIRLIVKGQGRVPWNESWDPHLTDDPRIEIVVDDMPTRDYLELFASCDVCIAPSRWEGLGLHLYEAIAFGMPIITNDRPPMNEVVHHDQNGLLVKSRRVGRAKSGIGSFDPDSEDLSAKIAMMIDPDVRKRLSAGSSLARERLSWHRTQSGFADLLDALSISGAN